MRPVLQGAHGQKPLVVVSIVALALAGCGSLSHTVRAESPLGAEPPTEVRLARLAEASSDARTDTALLAQATAPRSAGPETEEAEDYDPWEPFNEKMFEFNRNVDKAVVKPVAQAYNFVLPDRLQIMIGNGFDNIRSVPRFINSLLQGKWDGAVRELGRFLFNSTVGIGGLFDVATMEGIKKSNEDFGQTLAVWGSGPGPYLVVPFLPPMTVRDGVGLAVNGLMDPLVYVLPFIWDRLGMQVGETVNDRSLNLELFEGIEEATVDLYSAVRHGYLQRRERLIKE
ncbi:MAG: VacJ family lipoprotein [Candidatus Rokubacteria bacterium]|nr:VacJ family lipoprotein [Candidatus Rokubacteria bacterium]